MKLIIEENEQKMSESCMQIVLGAMMQDKRVNISLTSGRSPRTMYKMMIPYVKDQEKFKDVQYYIFDDGPWVGKEHGPIWDEMHELFYTPANIPDSQDVMVIGLGWDGHFCSNCPRCTPMDSYTYKIDRNDQVAVNPTYRPRADIPYVYTMGPKSLMRVKHLVMIVNGKEKAEILKQILDSDVTGELPSTVLKLHPNFTIIADKDAASLLNPEDYKRL